MFVRIYRHRIYQHHCLLRYEWRRVVRAREEENDPGERLTGLAINDGGGCNNSNQDANDKVVKIAGDRAESRVSD